MRAPGGSKVEDGDVEKVAQAFCLVQVVYVVVVAGRWGEAEQRREHWRGTVLTVFSQFVPMPHFQFTPLTELTF